MEIVDLLEVLDKDDDVPEGMQRRRGQDNFDQRMYKKKVSILRYTNMGIASEPRLARQQEELQSAWDQELEDIALDRKFLLFFFTSYQCLY